MTLADADFAGGLLASAPGKLVLLGEYAVLEGAPGIVCAVPHRAQVTVSTHTGSGWQVATPGLDRRTLTLHWRNGLLATPDGQNVALLDAVLRQLPAAASSAWPRDGVRLVLDSSAFHDGPDKMGFGSSAALCTALTGALGHLAEVEASLARALAAHRDFQDGAGSGIDVAASWSGGTLAFTPATARVAAIEWPDDLHGLVVWTGRPASTVSRLATLRRFAGQQPEDYDRMMQSLVALARQAPAAMASGAEFIALAKGFTEVLAALAEASQLAVWTPTHLLAQRIAGGHGVLYKTSGAGGGDCGIALATDPSQLLDLAVSLRAENLRCWPLRCDLSGLTVQPSPQAGNSLHDLR